MKHSKLIHTAIILIGIIFICIPIFHSNLWFDESYSVAISNHSYSEIWTIDGNDVHPVLYYWILHTIKLIFGSNILLYRLFSAFCISLIGIIGYTHIRKDFGEKAGLLFSLFTFFLPVNIVYAGEIRMYSLAMLLVTLMSIYAYRIYKKGQSPIAENRNWIIFAALSLACCYTHYYGLMIAGLENLFLFIFFTKQAVKQKKFVYGLKAFIIQAILQILLYIPWIVTLFRQMDGVSKGFWINIHFPGTFIELFTFPFTGNLEDKAYIAVPLAVLYGIVVIGYMIYILVKNRKAEELKPAKISIAFWLMVVLGACIVSIIIHRPIIYARYLLCVEGLLVFFISMTMSAKGNRKINIAIIALTILLSIVALVTLIQESYGKVDNEFQAYIKENIKPQDIFICQNEGSGFVISAQYPNNKFYFYDVDHWNVGPAYKAYGDTIYNLEFLKNYKGRVWLINTTHYSLYEEVSKKFKAKLIDQKAFSVEYKEYQYTLTLVEF